MAAVFEDDSSGFIELYNADRLIVESHQIGADGSAYITYYYYNRSFLIRAETRLFTPSPEEEAPVPPEDQVAAEDQAAAAPPAGDPALPAAEDQAAAAPLAGDPALPAAEDQAAPLAEAPALPPAAEGIEPVPVPRALGLPVTEPIVTEAGTEEPIWTDFYRYTRANALRSVERHYIRAPAEGRETELMRFPQLIIGVVGENEFIQPASALSPEFFSDVIINSGDRILYNTDSRGRVLSEVRRDENDEIIGEIINTWSGDRLLSVVWKSGEEERIVEYEYDAAGDRIVERNLRNGELERTVRREGEQEIEELYLNGEVALRALWVEGRKVSEEPVRPAGKPGRSE
jgi:hypothetical protein